MLRYGSGTGYPTSVIFVRLPVKPGTDSNQGNVELGTRFAHLFGPDACLDFADVCLAEVYHAESGLSDAASDAEWQ